MGSRRSALDDEWAGLTAIVTAWGRRMTYRPRALSVSSVQLYARCPAQWKQRYVDGLVQPTNRYLAFGTAFHRALEAEHKGEDAERALIAAWNAADGALAASGQTLLPGKAYALLLLDEYKRRGLGGKSGIPERKFTLAFPSERVPVPLTGYIDLLLPERRRFREYKTTSGASWTAEKIALEHQLHVYGWAYQRLFSHRPDCAEYVIFGTREPTVNVVEAAPSPDGFRLFEQAAALTWDGIVNERFDGCGTCALCTPPVKKQTAGPSFVWEE